MRGLLWGCLLCLTGAQECGFKLQPGVAHQVGSGVKVDAQSSFGVVYLTVNSGAPVNLVVFRQDDCHMVENHYPIQSNGYVTTPLHVARYFMIEGIDLIATLLSPNASHVCEDPCCRANCTIDGTGKKLCLNGLTGPNCESVDPAKSVNLSDVPTVEIPIPKPTDPSSLPLLYIDLQANESFTLSRNGSTCGVLISASAGHINTDGTLWVFFDIGGTGPIHYCNPYRHQTRLYFLLFRSNTTVPCSIALEASSPQNSSYLLERDQVLFRNWTNDGPAFSICPGRGSQGGLLDLAVLPSTDTTIKCTDLRFGRQEVIGILASSDAYSAQYVQTTFANDCLLYPFFCNSTDKSSNAVARFVFLEMAGVKEGILGVTITDCSVNVTLRDVPTKWDVVRFVVAAGDQRSIFNNILILEEAIKAGLYRVVMGKDTGGERYNANYTATFGVESSKITVGCIISNDSDVTRQARALFNFSCTPLVVDVPNCGGSPFAPPQGKESSKGGAIAGAVTGTVALIGLLVAGFLLYKKKVKLEGFRRFGNVSFNQTPSNYGTSSFESDGVMSRNANSMIFSFNHDVSREASITLSRQASAAAQ